MVICDVFLYTLALLLLRKKILGGKVKEFITVVTVSLISGVLLCSAITLSLSHTTFASLNRTVFHPITTTLCIRHPFRPCYQQRQITAHESGPLSRLLAHYFRVVAETFRFCHIGSATGDSVNPQCWAVRISKISQRSRSPRLPRVDWRPPMAYKLSGRGVGAPRLNGFRDLCPGKNDMTVSYQTLIFPAQGGRVVYWRMSGGRDSRDDFRSKGCFL